MKGLDVKVVYSFEVSLLSKVSLLKIVPSLEVESGTNDIKNYGAFEWERDSLKDISNVLKLDNARYFVK